MKTIWIKKNSVSATPIFWNCDCSKSICCRNIAKMKISMVKTFVQRTAQKKFSIKDFFSKCNQICSFLRDWTHLLKKALMENFFCVCGNKAFWALKQLSPNSCNEPKTCHKNSESVTPKPWLLKVDFLYKISKNEHFNDKNVCPTERLDLK